MHTLRAKRDHLLFPALVALAATVVLGIGAAVLEFTVLRGVTPNIDNSGSISSLEKHEIGGVEQWILVRGHDRSKPVVLFLHGGPGMPVMYLAHAFQRALEHDYVVVHWDRRGAGKSFDALSQMQALSVSQTLEDTYELTRILRQRFGQQRIYLVGHSWGSYLGLLAAPEYTLRDVLKVKKGADLVGREMKYDVVPKPL